MGGGNRDGFLPFHPLVFAVHGMDTARVNPDLQDATWARSLARTGGGRVIREGASVSLRELAAEIGVSPSALSKWERGVASPRLEAATRWARALRAISGMAS